MRIYEHIQRDGGERENLAAYDDDSRKRVPESRQGIVGAVIAEDRTGPLNPIDESDYALHHRKADNSHLRYTNPKDDRSDNIQRERYTRAEEVEEVGESEESYFFSLFFAGFN